MPINIPVWIIGAIVGGLQIFSIIISFAGYFFIRFNDLKHLSTDVKEIKEAQFKENADIAELKIGQATMKAVCDERSNMYRFNKKVKAIRNR